MATKTVSPGRGRVDLEGACAVLRAWLMAHDGGVLDAGTAQSALRTVCETMLCEWADSPEAAAGESLMFGVGLLDLAEQCLWASQAAMRGPGVDEFVASTVRRAHGLLERASLPQAREGGALIGVALQ